MRFKQLKQAFYMKEDKEKISMTEAMNAKLFKEAWSHKTYCCRYKVHLKFIRFNISEYGMRIQVESSENLKAKSQR